MVINKGSQKFLIVTVAAMSILISGCSTPKANNVKQQSTPIKQQQVQQPGNTESRIQIANEAAAKITELGIAKQVNVLVTKRKAYVAAVLNNNQQITRDVEEKIANQVRATDPNIQNVYVSTNPDLVNRFNTYVMDVKEGRPVTGFIDQFNEIVYRIFPNSR
ncbi:YhcN/YlaJ family sporulation lipoprotein [Paenibacillus sp. LMG 31456]|uniref:YhcN/YlaJ family sporulation lipoprotein n=1 Tax=Paenibacillus foliorum TaxID=2654974 RepID=A0A972JZF7_9BACL|nr:YhcN/YlaJ family sporulation lipoprotein [Paenibacillus foliorum]NOU92695.1 YhcN/YlaJ family sporulation lipoprotein [Paenibacillus foliorum]